MNELAEFRYRARFGARSFVPGAHAAKVRGGGVEVDAIVPLMQARDPRRLDLRASLRDPFGGWWVREFNQRSNIRVMAMVDLSASVAGGERGGAAAGAALDFLRALAGSAARIGDAFGIIAFDRHPVEALSLRPTRVRAAANAGVAALAAHGFAGASSDGIAEAAALLPPAPALVFLLSDFRFSPALLDDALAAMPGHDVVPVWLSSARSELPRARLGLVEWRDAESGRMRTLWMRRALRDRWAASVAAHRHAVVACLARREREPLLLGDAFHAERVDDYFAARS